MIQQSPSGSLFNSLREYIANTRQKARSALTSESRAHWIALAVICLIGVALRVAFIHAPMRYDESVTFIRFASRPLADGLSLYTIPNNHLLNTGLIRLSTLAFGNHPWAIRLPALIAGILMIPAVYVFARTFYDGRVGLLAAGLVAAASHIVRYSVDGRGYTMVALLFLIQLTIAGQIKRKWNTAGAILMGVVGALTLYTIPTGIYPVAAATIWLIVSLIIDRRRLPEGGIIRDCIISGVVMAAITLALYSPVVIRSGLDTLAGNSFVRPKSLPIFLSENRINLTEAWTLWNDDLGLVVSVLLLVGFALSLIAHRRIARDRVALAPLAVAILATMVIAQRTIPPGRTWSFLLAVYLTGAAAGIVYGVGWAASRLNRQATAGLMVGLSMVGAAGLSLSVYFNEANALWDMDLIERQCSQIANALGDDITREDSVLTYAAEYPPIRYYLAASYGLEKSQYVTWTRILQGEVKPKTLFIVLKNANNVLEASPQAVIAERGLNPDDYSEPVKTREFDGVVMYVAHLK